MQAIGVPAAQRITTGSKEVTVGILDTGEEQPLCTRTSHSRGLPCIDRICRISCCVSCIMLQTDLRYSCYFSGETDTESSTMM